MARKLAGFRDWVGSQWRRMGSGFNQRNQSRRNHSLPDPKEDPETPRTTSERLEQRFEDMMQEIDQLSQNHYSLEEHAEYSWIVLVRLVVPLIFFLSFGYEDGLFMTGFRDFSWERFILIMYVIGYALEGLRVAMVYSMNFSKSEERKKAYKAQLIIWAVMSLGCGVAQLASAIVIQALGGDQSVAGDSAIAQGAKAIMATIPWLVYAAIAIRVVLCAVADWACSGHLHKKKETIEQKVAKITTRATNLSTVIQSQINAQSMIDNARQFQAMVQNQREELQELRAQQKTVFDVVFQAGMRQINRVAEEMPEDDA
ncbi:hypothetical protein KSD_03830 [Ktedonobacter sp. SOSP1-85]|uniref:ABC transporter permease n=1 Tax=Ktedonobacter sp. SOSP1-85 TaxID=2778367 RepID=UPI001915EAF3|nr:ABC transporter permease [Ktedonobacter sp. SOSP1-85]GHO72612.1 hypothetical protein KSD_03830 [Ktedonobacter sp. SOSP1-85]